MGGFDADAAVAVAGGEGLESWDVLDALSDLVAKSMLVRDNERGVAARYRLLETLRQYGLESLAEQGALDRWRRRHAQHYAAVAESAGPALLGRDEVVWRTRLRDDLDNLRSAVSWSLGDDDGDLGVRIVAALAMAAIQEAITGVATWAEAAVERARSSAPGLRMAVLCAAAWGVLLSAGDPSRAQALTVEAFRDGPAADCPALSFCYVALALSHSAVGERAKAAAALTDGVRTLKAIQAPVAEHAFLHGGIAFLAALHGDLALARASAAEALRLARLTANPSLQASALSDMARAEWSDDPDAATRWLDESIALTTAGASGVSLGFALALRAELRARAGRHADAITDLRDAIRYSRDKGDWIMAATAVDRGVLVLESLNQPDLATFARRAITTGAFANLSVVPRWERRERYRTLGELHHGDERHTAAEAAATVMSRDETAEHLLIELNNLLSLVGRR